MWYLCVFYHRLLDYRKAEVESLAELFGENGDHKGKKLEWKLPLHHHPDSPFHFVDLSSDDIARNIANRSILVKGMYELWGQGSDYEELEESIRNFPEERKSPYLQPGSSFKISVESFGKAISFQEQNERIQGLAYIPFKGQVNLKSPDHKFCLLETADYGLNNGLPPIAQRRIFFGPVGGADRKLIPTYQLKSRTYLGPTAMDAEMAFLMANQALATSGKLVFDPFVGTGSILVGAAHFGAMTMGADIDIRVVRDGRGPDCNVWSNFKQYGLPPPIALLRADNNLPPWRPGLKEGADIDIRVVRDGCGPDCNVWSNFKQYGLPPPIALLRADNNLPPWRPGLKEGADIDIRVVRDGRGPDCNVWSNFKQYGLPPPIALLRADNNLPPWRPGLKEGADIDIRVVRDGCGPDCNVWSNFKQYGLPPPIALLRADNNLPPWRPGLKEGADIDIRVVRDGRGPDCNVWSNFKQYGLPPPIALLRADNNLPPWRPGLKEILGYDEDAMGLST
ncbi:tRNA (guanine(10)-N2)-methyltransferase homolog isoform X5 [Cucumis sativus]|uniref:tRNA (guanine(10)-N2)-methyltransferase homolog isoform X5 n=1 Tax=Cucumis sativus TaxID=3659 RepID=UPI0012F49527|nr:tRNA (guanine(10)-N2)-methyltransferase homolog isoform X5 [Cucumis sativus]